MTDSVSQAALSPHYSRIETTLTDVQPVPLAKRTAIVDVLRGWAILGVAMGNYSDYAEMGDVYKHAQSGLSLVLGVTNTIFFAAKSWTLLSILFGYGFAIVMENVAARKNSPIAFFTRRMFWLFVIGLVNSIVWYGDILKDYAVMGLVLLLFYKASDRMIFWTAVALLAVIPFVSPFLMAHVPYDYDKAMSQLLPLFKSSHWTDIAIANLKGTWYLQAVNPEYGITVHLMQLACMLLGFSAQRIDFFNRLAQFRKQIRITFFAGLVAAISLLLVRVALFKTPALHYFSPSYWQIFSTMLMIASGICWLYLRGAWKRIFAALQAMGKLTLTNYIVQNLLAVFLFLNVGLGLFKSAPYWLYIVLAISVFVLQTFISTWWLGYFNYGPVEWVWRQLTYVKRLRIRKSVERFDLT